MAKAKTKRIPVLVCTDKRGVFFGYADPADLEGETWRKQLTLTQCRMCVYWSTSVKGVLGLQSTGPDASCRVTPAVLKSTLTDLRYVGECDPSAIGAWEAGPWG